jgi:HSP20 family protein
MNGGPASSAITPQIFLNWEDLTLMMSRYEPFRSHLPLRDAVDRLFQDSVVAQDALRHGGPNVPVDLHETADAYVLTASLAGWQPNDVNVTVQDNTVSLAGDHKQPAPGETDQARTYHIREWTRGSFQRAFTFPTAIDANQATADFQHGVLTLTLPKAESAKPRKIPVRVGYTAPTTGPIKPAPVVQPPEKQPVASKK